ncbi:MAG: YIP1 family protein [Actinomycetota bacterium]|nr:YIP1 family protein [Actinomycetota bacterium]
MASSVHEDMTGRAERAWWRRTVGVLTAPRRVFAALDDDTQDDLDARQEPLTAIVFLAGIAAVLATPATGRLLDDVVIDGLLVLVLAVFTGGIYAAFGYFVLGGAVYLGARAAGSSGSYRRARHIFGFALVPLALSLLLLWPARLALYGSDSFRSGGSDAPTGDRVFAVLQLGFAAWTVALLVLGLRVVECWSWGRALAGVTAALAVVAALVALFRL